VRTLSFPTLGLLIDLASEPAFKRTELATVMMRCDFLQGSGDVIQVLQNNVIRTRTAAEAGNPQAHSDLLLFARLIAERRASRAPLMPQQQKDELREAMLADGYEITWEPMPDLPSLTARCTILPTDAGPVPLARQISALEHELGSRSYHVALNHYQQAVETFEMHNEAANGQLRTALEELVMRLAEDQTSYTRPARAGDGSNAIKQLSQSPHLAADDGGDFLKGLWAMTHTKGSHPGKSDADETRFRLHVITATARLLLHRFPAGRCPDGEPA
jgi:hypothetical protein